jgi:hypothetical protein
MTRSPGPDPTSSPIRRRTLLTAATAGAVGAFLGAGRAQADPLWYQLSFAAMVAADPDIRAYSAAGQEFWYRPRQLLVAPADQGRVFARLTALGYPVTIGTPFAGVARLRFAIDVDVKALVDDLRDATNWLMTPPPAVQPHHVVFGYPNVMGNPGSAPVVAGEQGAPQPGRTGANLLAGICDTGIWSLAASRHPKWFGEAYEATPADFDPLYTDGSTLALQGGHGTFVAGVLRRTAPSIRFDPTVALSPDGIGDEESVCAALAALSSSVSFINLSLGTYTQDDLPSLPLSNAVAGRLPRSVVVAAAGNAASTRPTWPAALPDVVAVTALGRDRMGALVPAEYGNHGPWVDLCAPAEWTGPYVTGSLEPPEEQPLEFSGWASWQGTSFAVPYAIGRMAALVTGTGVTPSAAAAILRAQPAPFPGYGAVVP